MLQHHGWRAGRALAAGGHAARQLRLVADRARHDTAGRQTGPRWACSPATARCPTALRASVLLPQGRKGPAFLAYPNFRVLFDWNKSFVYVTTAAYFATRLEGAPPYAAGNPDPALSAEQMTALQEKLAARGHDVGKIDGILGARHPRRGADGTGPPRPARRRLAHPALLDAL